MKLLLIINILFSVFAKDLELKRLDPHGSQELKFQSSCTVCHIEKKDKIILKNNFSESCLGCHNKSPHSGVADHMGKLHKGEKISCTSCHSSHRKDGPFMVKKACTECHKW